MQAASTKLMKKPAAKKPASVGDALKQSMKKKAVVVVKKTKASAVIAACIAHRAVTTAVSRSPHLVHS